MNRMRSPVRSQVEYKRQLVLNGRQSPPWDARQAVQRFEGSTESLMISTFFAKRDNLLNWNLNTIADIFFHFTGTDSAGFINGDFHHFAAHMTGSGQCSGSDNLDACGHELLHPGQRRDRNQIAGGFNSYRRFAQSGNRIEGK